MARKGAGNYSERAGVVLDGRDYLGGNRHNVFHRSELPLWHYRDSRWILSHGCWDAKTAKIHVQNNGARFYGWD